MLKNLSCCCCRLPAINASIMLLSVFLNPISFRTAVATRIRIFGFKSFDLYLHISTQLTISGEDQDSHLATPAKTTFMAQRSWALKCFKEFKCWGASLTSRANSSHFLTGRFPTFLPLVICFCIDLCNFNASSARIGNHAYDEHLRAQSLSVLY